MTPERQLELFDRVAELESGPLLSQLVWNGINLWALFRMELLDKVLRGEEVGFEGMVLAKPLGWRQRLSLRRKERSLGKRLAGRLAKTSLETPLLVVSHTDGHDQPWGERTYNRHLDPFLEAVQAAGMQAEKVHAWSVSSGLPTHPATLLFDDPDAVNEYLWLGQKLAGFNAPDAAWEVGELLNVNVERVMKHAAHVRQWMELLQPWMDAQPVEGAALINYHNPFCMALTEVLRLQGKPAFDVQHGKQGALNFSYSSYGGSIPLEASLLPGGYWNWNASSAASILQDGQHFRCAVGGNLWLNSQRVRTDFPLSLEEQIWLEKLKDAERSLLFCAQPQSDYVIPEYFEAFVRSHPEIEFGIRLHPRQRVEEVHGLQALEALPNVNVREACSVVLFAALQHVDIVATRWSTVAVEARQFGKQAWVTDPFGVKTFAAQIEEGQLQPALDLEGWETALQRTDWPDYPASEAPRRSSEQVRACVEFLLHPSGSSALFDPDNRA